MTKPVVTRFAPSPTGYLHIGGARTALFNWLYARHTGGKFLLRIEDTDRERSTEGAIRAILDGLKWLELDWDGEPLYQFARADRHREVALKLLADGKAYRCYLTQAELDDMHKAIVAERELAKAEKRSPRGPQTIQSPWRDRDPAEAPAGASFAIRLKAPREGETVIDDQVQGRVVVPNTQLDDMIILRSDGTPVYNHAVVVDDHDMGITHVIRGVDHLTNAARQVMIYKAMGWNLPVFAHVPLIHGPDGAKLSKRHGALGIEAYRQMGFIPAGLRNYLVRLGWSHGDDEIFSTEQAVAWFDIADINKAPGRLDFAKLADVNGHWIRQAGEAELLERIGAMLAETEGGADVEARMVVVGEEKIARALPALRERAKTLRDIVDGMGWLLATRPLTLDDKAQKLLDADSRSLLGRFLPALSEVSAWAAADVEASARTFAEAAGLKIGKIAQPLRAALTGRSVSPSIFEVMEILGREETLARLRDQAA